MPHTASPPRQSPMGWIILGLVVGLALAFAWIGVVLVTRPAHAGTVCMASWYERGHKTASGERFDPDEMTAAMLSRAFGRHLRVTHLGNGRSVVVRHTDYGPAKWTGRCIDLSRGAARALGMIHSGTARVRIDVMK